jgi:hypothetical protein
MKDNNGRAAIWIYPNSGFVFLADNWRNPGIGYFF